MDIYLISDTDKTPDFPEELNLFFLDKFSLEEFRQIEKLISKRYFFEDFRLTYLEVKLLYIQLLEFKKNQDDLRGFVSIIKLDNICQKAINDRLGIISYSD